LIVHLDHRQHGLGSNSCGPPTLPQHALRPEPFAFGRGPRADHRPLLINEKPPGTRTLSRSRQFFVLGVGANDTESRTPEEELLHAYPSFKGKEDKPAP
jgi:hypothetical protein